MTVPTDTTTAMNLTAAQAATYSSYNGFNPSIWTASTWGNPILGNLIVYTSTSSSPVYGLATNDIGTLALSSRGLQADLALPPISIRTAVFTILPPIPP